MTATPTISIAGTSISAGLMTKISGGSETGSITQLGQDIDGEAAEDRFGWSNSMSSDGSRVAIGTPCWTGSEPSVTLDYDNKSGRVRSL